MKDMIPYKVRFTATMEYEVYAEDWKDAVETARNKFSVIDGKCARINVHEVKPLNFDKSGK